jgi:hypothetical protein
MEIRECALCGEERPVERPECRDGHGEDCPEAFCALCGAATWVGISDYRLTRSAYPTGT